MPTIKELQTLYDKGRGKRNRTSLLENGSWYVWSGEMKDSSSAWRFYFRSGTTGWGKRAYGIFDRAFAVRSRSDG